MLEAPRTVRLSNDWSQAFFILDKCVPWPQRRRPIRRRGSQAAMAKSEVAAPPMLRWRLPGVLAEFRRATDYFELDRPKR